MLRSPSLWGLPPVLILVACAAVPPIACSGENGAAQAGEALVLDAHRAWAHLEAQVALGPRPAGSEAAEETRAYIEAALEGFGLEPVREAFTASTPRGPLAMANVYVDLPGRERGGEPPPMVLVVSHFDTKSFAEHWDPPQRRVPFVGANDGASNTAVLLELARVLAAGGPRTVTYRLLFVDGEEAVLWNWDDAREQIDNRYGSRHHAASLRRSGLARSVKACIVIDLVGDEDLVLNDDMNSDRALMGIFRRAAHAEGLGAHVAGRRIPIKDDHQSFLEIGIPSVDLIDLEYGPDNRWWHTGEDTLEHCSVESLDVFGRILARGLPGVESFALGG
ncbi:MAG: M28 family peptidase [Planctomycetota bacterium]|jgi:hypothetical protein|nr:M28 family peptidase [Planctomycetota bacterium]MDP6761763.1 M28 family peptidase [Planctomycetota bacterium]MDP6988422.1 M28 family peptidase [Planctomycetota bacterium]